MIQRKGKHAWGRSIRLRDLRRTEDLPRRQCLQALARTGDPRCTPACSIRLRRMADSSFDIVSKVDHQEADNALQQARKEVEQRYDFKGTNASIDWSGDAVLIKANSEERAKAVLDVFQSKLIKRG